MSLAAGLIVAAVLAGGDIIHRPNATGREAIQTAITAFIFGAVVMLTLLEAGVR